MGAVRIAMGRAGVLSLSRCRRIKIQDPSWPQQSRSSMSSTIQRSLMLDQCCAGNWNAQLLTKPCSRPCLPKPPLGSVKLSTESGWIAGATGSSLGHQRSLISRFGPCVIIRKSSPREIPSTSKDWCTGPHLAESESKRSRMKRKRSGEQTATTAPLSVNSQNKQSGDIIAW